VLQTTGSASKTGAVAFFVVLPHFLAGVFGGTLVDRFGYKRISVVADSVSGVGIACIPLLYETIGLEFWQLLALVFVGALLTIPGLTARRSLLPGLSQISGIRLERTNSAFESCQNLAFLIGPLIAGILVGIVGAAQSLWIDSATFFFSAIVVATVIPSTIGATRGAAAGKYLTELVAGLRFLWRDKLLLTLAAQLALTNMLGGPLFAVVFPVYANEVFDSAAKLGLMVAAFGAGELFGSVCYGWFGHRYSRRALWIAAFLIIPFQAWILLLQPPLIVMMIVFFVPGGVSGQINPLLVTVRHERIPADLRGRVFSTFSAISSAAEPIGMLTFGLLLERSGLNLSIFVLGLGYLLIGITTIFLPSLKEMGRPLPESAAAAASTSATAAAAAEVAATSTAPAAAHPAENLARDIEHI
jgi:MFS family permease